MDVRRANNPEEGADSLYYRTKLDVEQGLAESFVQEELNIYAANKQKEAMNVVRQATLSDPESITRGQRILEALPAVQERFEDIDGYYQFVSDNNSPMDVETIRAKQSAVKGRAYQILEDFSEEDGVLDTVVNYASLLVPDFTKDAADLVDGSVFDSPQALINAVREFQLRDVEEQAVLIEEIIPAVWEAYDRNAVKAASFIETLFNIPGAAGDIQLGVALDIVDIADVGTALKAAKGFLGSRNIAARSADADGLDEAARRQIVASVDDANVEDAIGMSKVDAAHSANPLPTKLIDDKGGSVDNIAGIIDEIKAGQRSVDSVTDHWINQYTLARQVLDSSASKPDAIEYYSSVLEQASKFIAARLNSPALQKQFSSKLNSGADDSAKAESVRAAIKEEARESVKQPKPSVVDEYSNEANMEAVANLGKVREVKETTAGLVKRIITPKAFTPEEQTFAINKAQEVLRQEAMEEGLALNSMSVVARDKEGFTVRFGTTSGDQERTFKFTRDDVGSVISENEAKTFKQDWQNLFGKVFSPDVLLSKAFPTLVDDVTFAGQQGSILTNSLGKLWNSASKGLSKEESFQVDSILMAGDETSKVFSIAELREGLIETLNGTIKLNDAQIESYYAKRQFFDELHKLRDHTTKRQLEIEGYENLAYIDSKGAAANLVGRKRKTFDTNTIGLKEAVFTPDSDAKFMSGSSLEAWARQYKQDYDLVDLLQPIRMKDGSEVTVAMVRRDAKWSGLPSRVLNYQAGYVPRVYPRGYYYVRDLDSPNREVLYAFPTKEKADAWALEAGGNLSVYADREFNAAMQLVEDSNAFGGLYTGARKTQPLMLRDGDNVSRPERMSVAGATERYIQNISNILPLNDYRAASIERWKNTVNSFAKANNREGVVKNFNDSIDHLPKDVKDLMEQARQYIKENMGMPSREERATERLMLGAANMLYGKPFGSKPRQWLLDNSQGDVSHWIKGVSFNMHMGWFNLRQLFVQMQNASLAISMNPNLALPAVKEALEMRTIALLSDEQALAAGKHLGFGDELIQSVKEYNRSGLRDSITRQGDFDSNAAGVAKGSLDAIRKTAKAGRVFFNEGENFSRLMSWSISRNKWKQANPNKALDEDAIQAISVDALRMQMNLQSENAAWWQKAPVFNVATQFLQVQAKFLENVMPKVLGGGTRWSPSEKRRALAGQLFLYGVVGVPIAEEAISYAADLAGKTPQEFIEENPTYAEAINEGFTGLVASLMGAEDIAASESFSLLAGMDDNIIYSLAEGAIEVFNGGYSQEGAVEMFTGPSANIIRRFGDVGSNLMLSMKALYEVPSAEMAYEALISNVDSIAAMTSTWSNARKLRTLHNSGNLFSSRGKLIATQRELGELSLPEQLGLAMGFPTNIESSYYASKQDVRDALKYKQDAVKDIKAAMLEYVNTGNQNLYKAKLFWLLNDFSDLEKSRILQQINKDSLNPKSGVDRTLKQATRLFIESGGRVTPSVPQSQLAAEVE